jgi:hypothetical protein
MTTNLIASHVLGHYPHALPASVFRRNTVNWLQREFDMVMAQILLAKSMCADEIVFVTDVAGNVETYQATRRLPGVFEMGGLAGLPFAGKTGMAAFAQHVPDGGGACIIYGPHIGLSDAGQLGKLQRPGQRQASTACGALGVAIRRFQSSPDYEPVLDEDDAQESLLELRLKPHMAHILAAPNPLQAATEVAYTLIHDLIYRYVAATKALFGCERIALVGVVVINTGPEHEDYVDPRHLAVLRLADL